MGRGSWSWLSARESKSFSNQEFCLSTEQEFYKQFVKSMVASLVESAMMHLHQGNLQLLQGLLLPPPPPPHHSQFASISSTTKVGGSIKTSFLHVMRNADIFMTL